MRVFIVRPFGNRPVLKKNKSNGTHTEEMFDFEAVENQLMIPAINELKLEGGTTKEIFESGDIREDMFSSLLLDDIIIADITIHNANVFYELGIRHALRDRRTVLVKCDGYDETPFDILGYRYISYTKDSPGGALPQLTRALKETMDSDRKDSPVFNALPNLEVQDYEKYQAVPIDFGEELEEACSSKDFGKIWLLRSETQGFGWRLPALRQIGKILFFTFELYTYAAEVLEDIRAVNKNDIEANDWLSTIYQRLAGQQKDEIAKNSMLDKSDRAIDKLIEQRNKILRSKQAEVYALKGRNLKTRWTDMWRKFPDTTERQKAALKSQFLVSSIENYKDGFESDLNHYYSGINALCLVVLLLHLAKKQPSTWSNMFDTEEDAEAKLKTYERLKQQLQMMVDQSIRTELKRLDFELRANTKADILKKLNGELMWTRITQADAAFLSAAEDSLPDRIINKYTSAVEGTAQKFNLSSAMTQIRLFNELDVKSALVNPVLKAFEQTGSSNKVKEHVVLFTGHMIDKPNREKPRFPAAKEAAVREKIKERLLEEKANFDGQLRGIAGGACGGDILFHEVCAELSIPTEIYLAIPKDQFRVASVAFAGGKWVDRYEKLCTQLPNRVLSASETLPRWLQKKKDYNIWMRNNLWEMNSALIHGGNNLSLIALWDMQGGDGAGGTEHMVKTAEAKGAKTTVIDIKTV